MKWYRSYEYQRKEGEVSFDADSELDAENESFHWEEGFMQGKNRDDFEWTSSPYDRETMIKSELAKRPSTGVGR